MADGGNGYIYTSTDSGVTLTNNASSSGQYTWYSIASSADGTKLAAVDQDGYIYTGYTRFTPPIQSSLTIASTDTTYNLSYTTDEAASSTLVFNPAGISTYSTSTLATTTSHSFTLNNLLPCTKYQYKLSIDDIFANSATSTSTFNTSCLANATVSTSTAQSFATSTGGILSLGNLTLTVPSNYTSTSSSAAFQAFQLDNTNVLTSYPAPTDHSSSIGSMFQLSSLTGTSTKLSTFTSPLTVTLSYDPNSLGSVDPSSLIIYRNDGGAWQALSSCSVDTTAHTVFCQTSNFSTFGIFGTPVEVVSTSVVSRSGRSSTRRVVSTTLPASTLTPSISTSTTIFSKNLKLNDNNSDVKSLQIFLNTHGYIITTTGAGSPGNETTTFGKLTQKALIKFQKDNKITPAVGYFGVVTRGVVEGK